MELVDTVKIDARTVNDVKISEDGRIGVLSREGASNRRNGIVILDVSNPRDVKILSTYDDQLTGGVHNVFVYEDHVTHFATPQIKYSYQANTLLLQGKGVEGGAPEQSVKTSLSTSGL